MNEYFVISNTFAHTNEGGNKMLDLNFTYNPDENFYRIKWEGETKLEQIEKFWEELKEEYELNGGEHLFLVDNTTVHYEESTQRCRLHARFYEKNPAIFKDSKIAIVVTTPHSTARLFYIVNNVKTAEIKIFSTISATKAWLVR
ncbi:MAG: hypothetical protein ACK5JS_01410 [Mangrovibacterium sp.]